jgi:hypothetical protein
MPVIYSDVTTVSTQENPAQPPQTPAKVPTYSTLEMERWKAGKPNAWTGRDKVIEVEVKMSQGGRDQQETFGNRQLFTGNDDITHADAEQTARNYSTLLSFIYPAETNMVRAVIRQMDANGNPVPGQTRSFPLADTGRFDLPVGDVLAGSNIVATYEKASTLGRPGNSNFRNAVTATEYQEWTRARTVPARFNVTEHTLGSMTDTFMELLKDGVGAGTLTPCLPNGTSAGLDDPRPIVAVRFGGFRVNDPTRPKGSPGQNSLEAAQQRINAYAADARYLQRGQDVGNLPESLTEVMLELKIKASRAYWDLELRLRARINWPDILGSGPLSRDQVYAAELAGLNVD